MLVASMMKLGRYKAFIFDLDGCIYRGNKLIEGAAETIWLLRQLGKKILFLTNNATKTPEAYAEKLQRMKIQVSPQEVLTSGTATAIFLRMKFGKTTVLPIGGDSLVQELRRQGHKIVELNSRVLPRFVVTCLDYDFNYEKMRIAVNAILSGARFIATNTDPNVPVEKGFEPGAGAIVSAISTASGVKPIVIGKPSEHMMRMALQVLAVRGKESVTVGDRIDTDIAAGKKIGALTVLVLSGYSKRSHVESSRLKPDLILSNVAELQHYLI
jgi:HAD superfamily hydrolase (TIGR01457 family)